ncbi:MAG: hypothetical protein J6T10_22205 [Methanobrevibacter sp.]|nr:hypothetical protein [Methanobrevibacter sp.]
MVEFPTLTHFKFWCQKVLPLVYDDSLSYYEVLCKVVKYINGLIDSDKAIINNLDALKEELKQVEDFVNKFDNTFAEHIIESYLATMIFVEINDEGYIVYNIPERWEEIEFNTTGLDISIPGQEYGKLVLSY